MEQWLAKPQKQKSLLKAFVHARMALDILGAILQFKAASAGSEDQL